MINEILTSQLLPSNCGLHFVEVTDPCPNYPEVVCDNYKEVKAWCRKSNIELYAYTTTPTMLFYPVSIERSGRYTNNKEYKYVHYFAFADTMDITALRLTTGMDSDVVKRITVWKSNLEFTIIHRG